jgi:bacterioferritin
MSESDEQLDVARAIECLNDALSLQYRSTLQYTMLAGGMTGLAHLALRDPLAEAGQAELHDVRLLVEKITALGGEPTTEAAPLRWDPDPERQIDRLLEDEGEAIEALQAAIEPTGREGVSEALEHLLEHLILRKQRQVDLLLRARRTG